MVKADVLCQYYQMSSELENKFVFLNHKITMKRLSILALIAVSLSANAQQVKKVTHEFPLSGNEKWDYLFVNNNRLFVSHGNKVQVLDVNSGKEIASIDGLSGVHGIAIDKENHYGFISNGKQNSVIVFDNNSYKILDSVKTGEKPDAIILEPFTNSIVTGNGVGNSLSVIDATTLEVSATIALDGNPEYIVSDNNGMMYANIESKSKIAVIDMKTMTLQKYFDLLPQGEEPTGLAIDIDKQLLFAGCANKKLMVVDIKKGKITATAPIGSDCDGVAYSPSRKYVYASNKDGTMSVIHLKSDNTVEALPSIKTQFGAKTVAIDEANNVVYTTVAKLVKSQKEATKMDIVPNTFKVIAIQ